MRPLRSIVRLAALAAVLAWLFGVAPARAARQQAPLSFAATIARLSEPGGYFDTDNLISNERSYLHVVPALRSAGLAGGVYVGVGPDQNFSYIAAIRPARAFIIDIRRDNLLLHLLFKALFQLADSRAEYLSLLFGRPPPATDAGWAGADVDRLAALIDKTSPTPQNVDAIRRRVDQAIKLFGVPLSDADLATIDRFHRRFIAAGLELQFETTGRAPQSYYPTYRDLLFETDRTGRRGSYLAAEADFQTVRSLQRRDLIVPIVGNLSGPSAMGAIGRFMADRGEHLAAFYASNVEFYLFGDGTFPAFVKNLSGLPRTDRSLIVRSVFGGRGAALPADTAPGYASASIVQPVEQLVSGYARGGFRAYWELTAVK